MQFAQYSSISLLIGLLSFTVGCNSKDAPTATPTKRTPVWEADDAASVAAIEKMGAKLKWDGQGRVVEVDFRDTLIDDAALDALTGLKSLRSLNLSDTAITDVGMARVGQLTTLTNLDLRGCHITNVGLAAVEPLSNLRALRLSGKSGKTDISDNVMPSIGKLKHLKVLAIDFLFAGSADGISSLTGLPITEFYASHSLVDDECLAVIAEKLPDVKKLRVSGCNVSGPGLQIIGSMNNLEELDLSEIALIVDSDLAHLANMKQLKKLNLWRVQITDEGVASLAGLTNLEWLNLDNVAYLSDDGLKHLKEMTKLKFLHLGSTSVGDQGMQHLAHLTALEDLKVTRTAVTQAGVDELKKTLTRTAVQLEYEGGE